jgi:hypothetical protein
MNRLHVKSESLPTRCEVCHQADCFDAATGKCTRCIDVSPPQVFAGGRKFEPRGVWQDVRWLIGFLVIAVSVWGGIYQQLSWTPVRETRDPEMFAMTDFEGAVSPQPRIVKRDDGGIRAWNLNGGIDPFMHEAGLSYTPTARFSGKVIFYYPSSEFGGGTLLLEEGPGRIVSLGVSRFYEKKHQNRSLIEEAFQPGRFIQADCEVGLGLFCGNTLRSEWIQARDEFEGWQPGSFGSPTIDSFESEALGSSETNVAREVNKVEALALPPAMPAPERTGPYFLAEQAGVIRGLCGGYEVFPTRTFTGQIANTRKKSHLKTNYLIEFMTEDRGLISICTDLRAVAAPPVTWERFEKMLQPGNQAKLTVRVVYGGVFVLDSIGNVTR